MTIRRNFVTASEIYISAFLKKLLKDANNNVTIQLTKFNNQYFFSLGHRKEVHEKKTIPRSLEREKKLKKVPKNRIFSLLTQNFRAHLFKKKAES